MAREILFSRRRLIVLVVAVLNRWVVDGVPTMEWGHRLHRNVLLGIIMLVRALIMNCPHGGHLVRGLLAWLVLLNLFEVRSMNLLTLLKPLLMLDVPSFFCHERGSHHIQILH